MRVFISWSGTQSKVVALALQDWLHQLIPASDPWMSAQDISPGERWNDKIARQLDESTIGIICLTRSNQHAPWIQFEAGAISKAIGPDAKSRVIPVLIDFQSQSELSGPLTAFNNVMANEAGFRSVLKAVFSEVSDTRTDEQMTMAFDTWWPQLTTKIDEAKSVKESAAPAAPAEKDMIEEILTLVRSVNRGVSANGDMIRSQRIADIEFIGQQEYSLRKNHTLPVIDVNALDEVRKYDLSEVIAELPPGTVVTRRMAKELAAKARIRDETAEQKMYDNATDEKRRRIDSARREMELKDY